MTPGWLGKTGILLKTYWLIPATGAIALAVAAVVLVLQGTTYTAEARILTGGGKSADEIQALAVSPAVVTAARQSLSAEGSPRSDAEFLRGTETEQLLGGGILRLAASDRSEAGAEARAMVWARSLCAVLQPNLAGEGTCYTTAAPVGDGAAAGWKLLTAALVGMVLGGGGTAMQLQWKTKETASMAKREDSKTALPEAAQALIRKLKSGRARVGVVGLGYVGLPLVDAFGHAGYSVAGIDVDGRKVDSLRKGKSYIEDIPSGRIAELARKGILYATTDFSVVETLDAVSICVPTPLRKTGDPDLSFIVNVTEEVAKYIHKGMVIVLESTTYPGTTKEILLPKFEARGLKVGVDLFLAFSPERVDPGREDWKTVNTPKVIGGTTPACLAVATAFYGRAIKNLVPVSSTEAAEMTKLLENTFRAVNIGLVNEVAIMCDHLGLDVWEVIDAAASKPFGFMKFTPGPGLGGHCIPIDPLYLSWKLKSVNYNARFIELATEVNTSMPRYVVEKVQDALNTRKKSLKGSRVLVLGVAYKPNVSDLRESPALDVIGLLKAKGAVVDYHDPHVAEFKHEALQMRSVPNLAGAVEQADCVVITTDHSGYNWEKILSRAKLIVDTRNALGELGRGNAKVVRL